MIEFVIFWFGIGAFVAVVNFVQWCLDGYLISEGDDPRDRFYYLYGMLQNVASGFVLGPMILVMQIAMGMPILPRRKGQ